MFWNWKCKKSAFLWLRLAWFDFLIELTNFLCDYTGDFISRMIWPPSQPWKPHTLYFRNSRRIFRCWYPGATAGVTKWLSSNIFRYSPSHCFFPPINCLATLFSATPRNNFSSEHFLYLIFPVTTDIVYVLVPQSSFLDFLRK